MVLQEGRVSGLCVSGMDTGVHESRAHGEIGGEEVGSIIAIVRDDISKIDGYVERIIPGYLPEQFKRHFRLSRETFECILNHLANFPTLQRRQQTGRRLQTTLEKDLMMQLWYLGTQETVRSISDRFDVQESTLILHNRRLIDVFSDLCKKFVKWPNNEEKQEIMSEFEDFSGFPGFIGALMELTYP
ncbi:uncharacterized protein LOC134255556 [Saccostrea cucullata]|uniref:uncharacterized protein LOC134255556 n=1 Tax=Saccostrea cuccullata TaxID=36930 RepID=UPI002ED1BA74